MTSELNTIRQLINDLTEDEDLRQELWIHFLSGHASSSFIYKLEILKIYRHVADNFQYRLASFIASSIPVEVEDAILVLAPAERRIVYLLICGLSPHDIARYNNICTIKVYQTIASIQASEAWRSLRKDSTQCSKNTSKTMSVTD